jgi:hypothetical protein
LDIQRFRMAIIFDRNSTVCFHKGMAGQGFTKSVVDASVHGLCIIIVSHP